MVLKSWGFLNTYRHFERSEKSAFGCGNTFRRFLALLEMTIMLTNYINDEISPSDRMTKTGFIVSSKWHR
jgi:hypothetical protein